MTPDLPYLSDVPDALADREQWVCWEPAERDGKQTKVPLDPATGEYASTTDDTTWASFTHARDAAADGTGDGIGFVFTATDPFVGVDLDDCRVPETGTAVNPAPAIIDQLDSYTEVSPSGTGFHVIVAGDLPDGRNRHGDVELYDRARYFTVTGDHCEGTLSTIEERSDALAAVHDEYVAADDGGDTAHDAPRESAQAAEVTEEPASQSPHRDDAAGALSDDALLEKARNARNGDAFAALWRGSTAGYDSHSEADMALCCHLAFWTGGDPSRVDSLFRDSGLLREKWDEPHYADGRTYGEVTVQRAVAQVDETYDPTHDGTTAATSDQPVAAADGVEEASPPASAARTDAHPSSDVDVLYERIDDLTEAVERLEAENERLRAELKATRDATTTESGTTESADRQGLLAALRSTLPFSS